MALDTLFTNESSALAGTSDYVKDVFQDVTLPANNNSGYTDTAVRNPFGLYFGNDNSVRYGAKKLYLKDLRLINDRNKWINSQPTYQIIFEEDTIEVVGYVFGSFNLYINQCQPYLVFNNTSSGAGITGIVRRIGVLSNGDTTSTTVQMAVDGSNTTTISLGDLDVGSITAPRAGSWPQSKLVEKLHAATNETKDIHDIRFTATAANNFTFLGFDIYHENTGANIDVFPGVSYVNKTKISTTTGATFALPTYGSSLGGNLTVYNTESNGYQTSAVSSSAIISIAQGTSGGVLVTVTTGQGASFKAGYGIVVPQGTSHYVGIVQSVSTDTLTVAPALHVGLSSLIYTNFKAGTTQVIGSSLFTLKHSIDFTQSLHGMDDFKQAIHKTGEYFWYGNNIGATGIKTALGNAFQSSVNFLGASGGFFIQGAFEAAEIEWGGTGTLSATFSVNGMGAFGYNTLIPTYFKHTVVTDAGNGWNSIAISPGASMHTGVGIKKINLYQRSYNQGISFGFMGAMETMQSETVRTAYNTTTHALGLYRRVPADQLYLTGDWSRGATINSLLNTLYSGVSTTAALNFVYYGKDVALIGTGASGNLSIDGASTANSFNTLKTVSSEGWHTIAYAHLGGTVQIQAVDFTRTNGEMKSLQIPEDPRQLKVGKDVFGVGYKASQFVRNNGFWNSGISRLGGWLSKRRTAGTYVYTTGGNATPTTNPSVLGYVIYGSQALASADGANEPSDYEIYVGKNKKIRVIASVDGSYTDYVSMDCVPYTTGTGTGCFIQYNKLTGILKVTQFNNASSDGRGYASWGGPDTAITNNAFFDVVVEDDDAQKGTVD